MAGSTNLDVFIGVEVVETLSDTWTAIERDWLAKRCKRLTIVGTFSSGNPWIRNLAHLEEVVFLYGIIPFTNVCKELQENSVKLFSLEVGISNAHLLAQFPSLVSRLRDVRVVGVDRRRGVQECTPLPLDSVEELLWSDLSSRNPLPVTTNRLRTLTLVLYHDFTVPHAEWNSLTELRILCPEGWRVRLGQGSLSLLGLKTLVLRGEWAELLWINAPALKTLELLRKSGRIDGCREALLGCILRPRVVHIEMCVTATILLRVLQEAWSNIEQLRCTYRFSQDMYLFPKKLLDYLSQSRSTHGTEEICPRLGTFTVILDYTSTTNALNDVVQIKAAMEKMCESREAFSQLTVALLCVEMSGPYGVSTEWMSFS
ncbi:SubName: Full=Uncharacterized protein {ECO:0000313/EMBL:CCA75845.1} [Serendipita indica DSM 11827]|nr:SubName: Full=Uncharacterized protein {ECO:0000313/EMBL:CCA75845.1} [Serendipita indica DSM 11827]